MRVHVEIDGMKEFRAVITDLRKKKIPVVVKQIVAASALNVQFDAKDNCAVDTGALRNSIVVDFYEEGHAAEIEARMPYAPFVEFGTRFQRAQPYMIPAFQKERPRFEQAIRDALREVFNP